MKICFSIGDLTESALGLSMYVLGWNLRVAAMLAAVEGMRIL